MTLNNQLPSPNRDKPIAIVMIIIFAIVALLMMSSCSPEKRLSKLLKHHPELQQTKVVITVKHDTLITKELHKDSVINNIYSKDTIYIHDGKQLIKYEYMTGSRAYISGTVQPDTVVKVDSIRSRTTTVIQQVKAPKDGWEWLQFWLTIAVISFVGIKYGGPLVMELLRKIPGFPL